MKSKEDILWRLHSREPAEGSEASRQLIGELGGCCKAIGSGGHSGGQFIRRGRKGDTVRNKSKVCRRRGR